MKEIKVGIVGCGAIGGYLARFIRHRMKGQMSLVALYDVDPLRARRLSRAVRREKGLVVGSLEELVTRADLVIEAAGAQSSFSIAKASLAAGCDTMVMSVGGIAGHLRQLEFIAKKHNARVYLPSGAIAGIDALKAARLGVISEVTLVTTKHPRSFSGVAYLKEKGIDPLKIKKETVVFSGSAAEAVRHFPQNINVAAVLGIAGIGEARTRVKIVASPLVRRNIHQVTVRSAAGSVVTRTENVPHPANPKTSFLAALSAACVLKQMVQPIRVGT